MIQSEEVFLTDFYNELKAASAIRDEQVLNTIKSRLDIVSKINKKEKFTALGADILRAFEEINPACKKMYNRPLQREACDDLIKEYTFERVVIVIKKTLVLTNDLPFFPTITTPQALRDKWSSLEIAIKKYTTEQAKLKSKSKPANVYW